MKPTFKRVYLGDSVYADFDGYNITLCLNNGMGDKNPIHMEPDVIIAFQNYLLDIAKQLKQPK